MASFEKMFVVFYLCYVIIACDETPRRAQRRKSRFISFDSEKNDIDVSLDFTVPFLSIPIKKAVDSFLGGGSGLGFPKVIINPTSLAFGGLVVMITSVFLPLLTKGFDSYAPGDNYYRVLDKSDDRTNILMELSSHLISTSRACPLRIACWVSQRSKDMEYRRTMEKIVRNKLFSSMVNTTAVDEAINTGAKGQDCSAYEPCPIREEHLPMLIRNLAVLTNT